MIESALTKVRFLAAKLGQSGTGYVELQGYSDKWFVFKK